MFAKYLFGQIFSHQFFLNIPKYPLNIGSPITYLHLFGLVFLANFESKNRF